MEAIESIEEFRKYLYEQEKSYNTIVSYMCSVAQFYSFSNVNVKEIIKEQLLEYKKYLMSNYKPATVNAKIAGLNEYLKFINKSDCLVKSVKRHKKISVENIIILLEYRIILDNFLADEKINYYFLVRCLGETGCRVSELVNLEVKHVRKGYAELLTKGKERRIYFPENLQTDLIKWLAEQQRTKGWLFLNKFKEQYSRNGVYDLLKRYAKKYIVNGDVVYPHSFRHMFAIEFLKRDRDIALLSDLLGHENISTTSIYLKLSSDEQKNRISKAVNW